jgi:hypothetical protein
MVSAMGCKVEKGQFAFKQRNTDVGLALVAVVGLLRKVASVLYSTSILYALV